MYHRLGTCVGIVIAAMTLVMAWPLATIADELPEDELAGRIAMVRTLLFESSAARRVASSDNSEAQGKRAEAIALFEAARAPGDSEARKEKLNRAVELFYQASAASPNSASADAKGRRDFGRRLDSVNSLLDAHKRIMEEKKTAAVHESLLESVETDIAAAESLLADGEIEKARERLDLAYDVTRLAVENSRMGETLKRELKFDTAEDEYHYELDRNETHRMLLTVLLKDKLDNDYIRAKVEAFVDTADKHRAVADDMAGRKRFDMAIQELERSTAEIVKAIRGAGVYIPG